MAALAREIGVPQEELTDEAVRAAMAKLSPAQLQKLAEEGKALTSDQAKILQLLGIKMSVFKLSLVCRWSEGEFEELEEDE